MAQPDVFVTAETPVEAEIVIKKSRFIGHVRPIQSADEAEAALAEVRELHKSANHNCFAYRVGLDVPVERFSDDGEPSGTAGRPILEVLRRRPVSNVLVVVTRYFGGVLLGTSGLVRAYADATVSALDAGSLLTCRSMRMLSVTCDYAQFGKLEHWLTGAAHPLTDKTFAENVSFTVWTPVDDTADLMVQIADLSVGQAVTVVSEPVYVGVRNDGSLVHGIWPGEAPV
jgi:uncharacterized YigZ family protein